MKLPTFKRDPSKPNSLLAVQMIARGLKCDALGCGYVDDTVKLNRKSILENLNRSCPQCGSNLLTEADARAILMHMRVTRIINVVLFPWMLLTYPFKRFMKSRQYVKLGLKMDGSGEVHCSDIEEL